MSTHTRANDMDDANFTKSSYSGSQGCVTVAPLGDAVAVRDSKLPEQARRQQTQTHPRAKFVTFIQALKDDRLGPIN